MQLWIALHLFRLPLEVFEQKWWSDGISAVLDQDRVIVMSRSAQAAGIKAGMRRSGVFMLEPNARVYDRSSSLEESTLQAVAMALMRYTPLVTLSEESSILIEIGASLGLFKGIRALCRLVKEDLNRMGLTGSLSCAPTARGAWLLARAGCGRALKHDTMSRRLDTLPALAIPAARPFATWLEGIGCQSIADLRRLPRPGLQRRCGRQLLATIDSAWGSAPELFEWVVPPEEFEAKLELFDRIENAELLLAGAQRLVLQLVGWLAGKQLAVERLTLFLEHERGREPRPPTAVEIVLAEAVWHSDHIIRLLKERLGKIELVAFVLGLTLKAVQLQPLEPPCGELFPSEGGNEEDQVRVLELLVARLGEGRVMQAKPIADHRPEIANAWVSVQEKMNDSARTTQLPPNLEGALRPTWLLPKPIALLVRFNRPYYGSPLRIVAGPERIEAGWWSESQARDYFVAQGEACSALYWIYRERISGDGHDSEPRFFLHGLFG